MQREVWVPFLPQRIVSLVPSQTELLFDLGVGGRVVGVTKFCVHPEQARTQCTVVGGTKNFRFDQIYELQPDLIIGNKEENYAEGIARLEEHFPVWMSDIVTLRDAWDMMLAVGDLTGRVERAEELVQLQQRAFQMLPKKSYRVLYLIWQDPWMAAGPETFIHHMMEAAGWENVVTDSRYPQISLEQVKAWQPEVILLSSEPFPFTQRHAGEWKHLMPAAHVECVEGDLFSWYGSRLAQTPAYIRQLQARW